MKELEEEKQNLERSLRKKMLEEYDGKIAELLAQLQSIEYAVSLERREANTRIITMEAQQVEKLSSLHQTIQELRGERNELSKKEDTLTKEVSTLQHNLHEAKIMLEKSQVERSHEISALHDSLREARSREKMFSVKEVEQTKRIEVLEQLLEGARIKVEELSKKDQEENKELRIAQDSLEQTKKELNRISQKNSEQLGEITTLKKSLMEARHQGAMLSRTQAEHTEELAILKQSLCDARNHGETMTRKYGENVKDVENLRQLLSASRAQEDAMKKKMDHQEKEIVILQEALLQAKADSDLLVRAEATHTEEISALRSALAETQKQADAAFKHAQHLCTYKNGFAHLLDWQSGYSPHFCQFVFPSESPDIVACRDQPETFCKDNDDSPGRPRELSFRSVDDGKIPSLTETGLKTTPGLEEENSFASQRQNSKSPPSDEENKLSQRQIKMTSGSNWKDEPHEAILRPKVVNTFQENEEISLSEREELLTLRALLKDVHSRNALFHKQVVSMNVPAEQSQDRRRNLSGGSAEVTTYPERQLNSSELGSTPRNYRDEIRNSVKQPRSTQSTFVGDNSRRFPEQRSKQSTAEAKSSLVVSAEVLKLNEQIARVREQLTTLCSSDQSISSCQKSSEVRMHRFQSSCSGKAAQTDEPLRSGSHELKAGGNSGAAKNKSDLHHRIYLDQQDNIAEKAPRGTQCDIPRRQHEELELEQPACIATKRSNHKAHPHGVVQSSEVFLPNKHTASKKVRPSARDSLGTTARAKVGRKIRVKVPSVTSSRSDVVCSHCQECLSNEDRQGLTSPSPELSFTDSPKPDNAKAHNHHRCSTWAHGHGQACVLTSLATDEKEQHNDLSQARTGSGSDDSDLASIIQHKCTVHPHDTVHQKKLSRNAGDKRDVTREDARRSKTHAVRDEHLPRKQTVIERKRGSGSGSASTPRRSMIAGRERVLSQHDSHHSRLSISRSAKI
ncbi:hypothetical protein AXG93_4010s1210 [Marchantia polymorpha subsp. ruderalis]|uniref:Uncharacterized protein n=1 Tax=Marchantia polymorpha subsp. ruderalis TaxID=1480154 RepID=A0A176VH99_MARPO|nr:hypothetical protein AXG93_4010s1210 [Marchantia polymorpha subsp. ruderalis]